ncbi:MAG: Holliday junction branch migration protein RuvA [Calditrichaeota bacterium]|nr:MAG: Holliday junction branch migration protein RuvA [Calditrichota bacterium]
MIERIEGKLVDRSPTFCILDCHGVGYGVHISLNTFEALKEADGQVVALHTYLYVREDALQLYGFARPEEKQIFQQLISVSGVGPRLALAILSGVSPEELSSAVQMEDVALLTRIPGVGRKTAQRLILELKEKLPAATMTGAVGAGGPIPAENGDGTQMQDALMALVSLGYAQPEARKALQKVIHRDGKDLDLETLIKLALREL